MSRLQGKKIFIAEDEKNVINILKLSLEAEGFKIDYAQTGADAIKKIGKTKPDLAILDISLPEVDGWQVLSFIKATNKKIPVLVLSAKGMMLDIDTSMRLGASAHMTKPFDIGRLIKKVKLLLKEAK